MNIQRLSSSIAKLNFTAIDFETANEQRASICSFGYAKVREGKIVETNNILLRPKELRFSTLNLSIHNITEDMVKDCPEFCDIWPLLESILENEILVAHNADFDISALNQTIDLYNLESPAFKYMCTHKLAQIAFNDLDSYKLPDIANYLGVNFEHHNSEADAIVAALIAIVAVPNIPSQLISFKHDDLTAMIAKKGSATQESALDKIFSAKKLDKRFLKPDLKLTDNGSLFYNQKVVLTGDLKNFQRNEAAAKLQALGAKINTSISAKTNIVVVGSNAGPSKMKKIDELVSAGNAIRIIHEEEFISILDSQD
jgi:DNA polymerase III subunit epsilon